MLRLAAGVATATATATALVVLATVATVASAGEKAPVITLTDGVISPQTVEVPAGTATTLTVANAGKAPAEFESKRLHIEQIIAPGTSATIHLPALPAGRYVFVEEFHETLATGRGEIVAR